jgi:hypothetical protein
LIAAPKVTYLVPSRQGYTPLDETTSRVPLRLTRHGTVDSDGPSIDFGQYFRAIENVVSEDRYGPLVNAAGKQLSRDISLANIQEILVYAEKHGSDYHPARIEVVLDDGLASFVMNVAITARGKAWLCREFEVLQHLNSKYGLPFLPQIYFQGEARYQSGSGEDAMVMFLADWLEGYHEFHLSIDEHNSSQRIVLWDTGEGHQPLSESQARQIYSQAAKIMTLYYDIETFEQIFPWHHAAGDFIVKAQKESIDVKLVTARQYGPMLEKAHGVSVSEALLFFLLNLSIRMRLDRLDGTGPVAWADDECVNACLEGFVQGLRVKERQGITSKSFLGGFLQLCRSLTTDELSHRSCVLIDACDQAAPDIPVIRHHLERHIWTLHAVLRAQSNW